MPEAEREIAKHIEQFNSIEGDIIKVLTHSLYVINAETRKLILQLLTLQPNILQ